MPELAHLWQHLVLSLNQYLVLPGLVLLHLHDPALNPLKISEALLITLLQVGIIALIFRPLESLVPAERWENRKLTGIDRLYTLIMLFGLFPIFSYLVLSPLGHLLGLAASASAEPAFSVKHWLPWLEQHPLWLLAIYYPIYDCVYYWMHRMEHLIPWWWALHSMHHSQRQMSCWTNDRGSYLPKKSCN
jgi:sterol desaturase/sphingolipid hydroxylase (fatty acid hydroxylase superfamily)